MLNLMPAFMGSGGGYGEIQVVENIRSTIVSDEVILTSIEPEIVKCVIDSQSMTIRIEDDQGLNIIIEE